MEPYIIYPVDMDDYAWWETEQKGWIEVTVRWASGQRAVSFYDATRLLQSVDDGLAHRGYFTERLVVVPKVTKEALESVVATMAEHDFIEMP
ncbi:hypothetical protein QLQ12_25975 [Actinoplanes sp. NEAU-A12]|uniref:Uncharacterized protein n=1 Tax=Actinoplanes sandaracinus TaxID=3045177 RepID=A0ABT6WQQ9_9ACTN|nr:hypothetical protein [Actinoplanes sandaracinus]MDI6102072.1 hypothetical protein [Actinoplanes sandaracinus]